MEAQEEMPGLEDVFEDAITCEPIPNDSDVLITLNGDQHYHILTLYKIYAESGRLEDPFTKLPLPKDIDLQIRLYGEKNKKYVDVYYETKKRIYVDGYSLVGDVILSALESLKKVSDLLCKKIEIDDIKGVYFLLSEEISSLCKDEIISVRVKDIPLDELEKEQMKIYAKKHRTSLLSLFPPPYISSPQQPNMRDLPDLVSDDTILRFTNSLLVSVFLQPTQQRMNALPPTRNIPIQPRISREEQQVNTFFYSIFPSFDINTIHDYLKKNQVITKDNIGNLLVRIYKKSIGKEIMKSVCQTQSLIFDATIEKKYWLFLSKMEVSEGEIEEQYLLALIQSIMDNATVEEKGYIRRVRYKATMKSIATILAQA